jgi:predicted transcriptional regulator
MGVMTIRLPEDQHRRLKALAAAQGVSLNRLVEALATRALAEHDVELRFRARAARGARPERGLAILAALDAAHRRA